MTSQYHQWNQWNQSKHLLLVSSERNRIQHINLWSQIK